MNDFIVDMYPVKAQFLKGEEPGVEIEWNNTTDAGRILELVIKIMHLDNEVECLRMEFCIQPGYSKALIGLPPLNADFAGYGADLSLYDDGRIIQEASTSFDVVSDWRMTARYGFLTDFYTEECGQDQNIKNMRKLHLNLVQFYDWMYRCDNLLSPTVDYMDLMGRRLNRDTVQEKILMCHNYGMKAIAYGAVYAASEDFFKEHRDWAMYNSNGKVVDFIGKFFIMDISPECPWHRHIIGEYKKAVREMDFDGIHMDTYGFPKTALARQNGHTRIVKLQEQFPVLIHNTKEDMDSTGKETCLVFNNVGNWPVDMVANSDVNVVYIEVWKPYERYHHIQQLIQRAKYLGNYKPVVLAAYMKPFLDEKPETMYRAEQSLLILTSIIASNGAYHLVLGENKGVLTQGYYVDYSRLDDVFFLTVRNYYDFIVRYENVLFDKELKDVSMTHVDGDNMEYVFEKFTYSTYGEPGKVWIVTRESDRYKTISFINLSGCSDDYWNKGKDIPEKVENMKVKIQLDQEIESVFFASPDDYYCRPQVLDFIVEEGSRGKNLSIEIPYLNIWGLLVIKMK